MTEVRGYLPISKRRFRMVRTVIALMLREMSTSYGRTPGGYAWAIIEPVGGIAVFSLVMVVGLKIRIPPLGSNFPLFFATGMLPFIMFNNLSGKIGASLSFSKSLLFYPGVTFVDAILARTILNSLTYLLVFYVVIAGMLTVFDTGTILTYGPIASSLLMTISLGVGVGTLNCFLFSTFPVWANVWGILTTPLMLVSGVIFLYDGMTAKGQEILWYNPLIHIIGTMRRGFYQTYDATYANPVYVYGIASVTFALGLLLLFRYHKDILNA